MSGAGNVGISLYRPGKGSVGYPIALAIYSYSTGLSELEAGDVDAKPIYLHHD
jgi:hypothetical protein